MNNELKTDAHLLQTTVIASTDLNRVHHADFLENSLPDKCAKLIISDPPYFEVKGYFDFIWKSFDDYLKDVEKWAIECKRILADNGTLLWWGDKKKIAYSQIILDKYFNLENSMIWRKKDSMQYQYYSPDLARSFNTHNERLLMYSNEINSNSNCFSNYIQEILDSKILNKKEIQELFPSKTGGLTGCVSNWLNGDNIITEDQFETLKLKLENYNPLLETQNYLNSITTKDEMTKILLDNGNCKNINSAKQNANNILNPKATKPQLITKEQYEKIKEITKKKYCDLKKEYEDSRRYFFNPNKLEEVLEFSQESHITRKYDHETKKPETLTRALIMTCSRKNDLVIIPFAGSGTECAMSIKEDRNFIAYEIEKKHVNTTTKRVKSILQNPSLFAGL